MRLGFWAVHFGKDYLRWAIASARDAVDELHVLYASKPSYGFTVPGAVCPDTEEELHAEALIGAAGKKLVWHRIAGTRTEGEHKNHARTIAQRLGASTYILMDADEVWDAVSLKKSFEYIENSPTEAGRWQVNFHHFWRSWRYTISDHFRPIRFVNMKWSQHKDAHIPLEEQGWPIFHFGYAQGEPIMRYKFTCHSHRPELVEHKIDEWLEKKFYGWKPGDEGWHHPSLSLWVPSATDEATLTKMREIMPDHPHKDLELV